MENKISKHIESKYKVIGLEPGKVICKDNTEVDLRTISLEKADELFNSGFPYLQKIELKSDDAPIVITENVTNENVETKEAEGNQMSTNGRPRNGRSSGK